MITEMLMTREVHRAFVVSGCDPHCHTCNVKIPIDSKFALRELAHYGDSKAEVMVCWDCRDKPPRDADVHKARMKVDPNYRKEQKRLKKEQKEQEREKYREKYKRTYGRYPGAFVVNGVIIP